MFLSQKFANTRSTKALRDYFALPESPPTPATLLRILQLVELIYFDSLILPLSKNFFLEQLIFNERKGEV